MANILDYVDWRGDVPLSLAPFNEVDGLIFSELAFVNFSGIVPEAAKRRQGVLLSDAAEQYFKRYPDDTVRLGLIVPSDIRVLLRRMAKSRRYGSLVLSAYVDRIDEREQKQFAALCVHLDKSRVCVVFRGTDDTLVGWKENFNMSFMQAVPAQLDAVAYLNEVGRQNPRVSIYTGGHSKGGNLSIYAAVYATPAVRSRVVGVYSYDGPGYRREVLASVQYQEVKERITKIIPQGSVVGRLLEHDDQYTVVHSIATGLWQHDAFSWQVGPSSFVPAPALSKESEQIDRSIKKWVNEMQPEQREKMVDALYKVLTTTNAKTLTELTRDRNWLWRLISESDAKSRKTVISMLTQLTGEAGRQWLEHTLLSANKSKKEKS